jgi:hypothetical protein
LGEWGYIVQFISVQPEMDFSESYVILRICKPIFICYRWSGEETCEFLRELARFANVFDTSATDAINIKATQDTGRNRALSNPKPAPAMPEHFGRSGH